MHVRCLEPKIGESSCCGLAYDMSYSVSLVAPNHNRSIRVYADIAVGGRRTEREGGYRRSRTSMLDEESVSLLVELRTFFFVVDLSGWIFPSRSHAHPASIIFSTVKCVAVLQLVRSVRPVCVVVWAPVQALTLEIYMSKTETQYGNVPLAGVWCGYYSTSSPPNEQSVSSRFTGCQRFRMCCDQRRRIVFSSGRL